MEIPSRFFEKNVVLRDALAGLKDQLELVEASRTAAEAKGGDAGEGSSGTGAENGREGEGEDAGLSAGARRYLLHKTIWQEIQATVKASLGLPAVRYADEFPAAKTHVLLQCPNEGSALYLDAVVRKLAASLDAEMVVLDAQDIAEIGGDYLGDSKGPDTLPTYDSIRSLGYAVYRKPGRLSSTEMDDPGDEEDDYDYEDEYYPEPSRSPSRSSHAPAVQKMGIMSLGTLNISDILKNAKPMQAFPSSGSSGFRAVTPESAQAQKEEAQWHSLVEVIASSPHLKRLAPERSSGDEETPSPTTEQKETQPTETSAEQSAAEQPPLIFYIPDYRDIQATSNGMRFLSTLQRAVRSRRRAGQKILIIGTSVSSDLGALTVSRSGFKAMQSEEDDALSRSIFVPPMDNTQSTQVFNEDRKRRTLDINLRHIKDMIRRRSTMPSNDVERVLQNEKWEFDSSLVFASGLDDGVWSFDRVHRLVMLALGVPSTSSVVTPEHIGEALRLMDRSDELKYAWVSEEKKRGKLIEPDVAGEDRIKQLRKKCNDHEKKLLGGVVDAETIRTTFADVHAPSDTKEALRTLTSLSLIRPDAFKYGVLATDTIPGLLLYGPPGTGKTLLAKAVAKESGATVLEVSGADVYDMYVGEGEKNIKAIFSLAKKLTPCVVFIDEADAIFGSRTGQGSRTTHRELINQFLREWDGMNELSAFIMVATNRPFDLDDAVLRRLPRRLVVDLPTEADREAILRIHLKDESVDESVNLSHLAEQTPLYSGSDLKNLCVAAALSCVREENEAAKGHTGPEAYQYPAKRNLVPRHFDQALEEISASISEDMSSLSAIRKFDEKYGDRKGRRKKSSSWGFNKAAESDKAWETGRVRN